MGHPVGSAPSFGRDTILPQLERGRFVVVVGPPGIGKSHLLREYRSRSESVWLHGHAERSTARWLRVPPGQVARTLAARGPVSLIFDDIDDVEVVAGWVDACPELRVVASSRRRPEHPSVEVLPLPPLSDDDSARLLAARIEAVRPGAAWDLSPIVERLDGNPRVVELVASWARHLGPSQIVRRLAERTPSVAELLSGALEELPSDERRALAELSVFVGGFDVEDARAVVSSSPSPRPTEDILDHLWRCSLIRRFDDGNELRFALVEPVRILASAHAASTEAEERHGRHVVERARSLASAGGERDIAALEDGLRRLRPELSAARRRALDRGDGRHALEATVVLEPLVADSDVLAEMLEGIDAAWDTARDCPTELRVEARRLQAVAVCLRGAFDEATSLLEEALRDAEGTPQLEAPVRNNLGITSWMKGDLEHARANFDAALALDPPPRLTGKVLINRGLVFKDEAEFGAADADYAAALVAFRRVRDERGEAMVLVHRSLMLLHWGRPDEAFSSATRANRILQRMGDVRLAGQASVLAGVSLRELERPEEAELRVREGLDSSRRVGDLNDEGNALGVLSDLVRERGALAQAEAGFSEARDLAREGRRPAREVLWLTRLAVVRSASHRHELARQNLDEARALARTLSSAPLEAVLELTQAELDYRRGLINRPAVQSVLDDVCRRHDASRRPPHLRRLLRSVASCLEDEPTEGHRLRVDPDARWFRVDEGPVVQLGRRASLRRLLAWLVEARRTRPGEAACRDDLRAAGWPGQRLEPRSANNRLYVAIATLRKLGMGDLLQTHEDGYLIDPAVTVLFGETT